jgi:predicted CXXCH cytochrome family protein
MAGPRKEYAAPLVVRCTGCHDPHATSAMTRKDGGWLCDKCVKTEFGKIWDSKL